MDAFRLLSRPPPTNRLRSAKSSITLPSNSSTQSERPLELATTGLSVDKPSTRSSKKRKRSQPQPVSDLPQELDFFGAAPGQNEPTGTREGGQDAGMAGNESGDAENEAAIHHQQAMPEDECRRILKQHKIKITRLDGAEQIAQSAEHKSKKRKAQKEQARKDEKKQKKHHMDVIPEPLGDFAELRSRYGINRQLAANIRSQGYNKPTEVQLAALPLLLDHHVSQTSAATGLRNGVANRTAGVDLLTVAPTGSGKTLAFLIPVIKSLLSEKRNMAWPGEGGGPRAIIVAPTKELANQTVHEAEKLAKGTGLRVMLSRKGMSLGTTTNAAKARSDVPSRSKEPVEDSESDTAIILQKEFHPDIIVTTPLTLVKAIENHEDESNALPHVRHIVLDEADVLLDPLFRKQTLQIWSACSHTDLRISMWSATMGASVEDLALSTIKSRLALQHASVPHDQIPRAPLLRLIVGLKDSAIPHIAHRLIYCGTEAGKLLSLRQLLRPTSSNSTTDTAPALRPPFLVFTQTIPRARALYSELLYDIPASAGGSTRIAVLHADLTSRARAEIMAKVRRGEVWVLITTDLLSRGVDFQGLNGVVNYDFPSSSAAYVHRVGRTGRAGREGGVAVTLYDGEDVPFVKNVANVIAAARRARGSGGAVEEGNEGDEGNRAVDESGLDKWLLESLPKPTKRDRQRLKKRGIESRRPDQADVKKSSKTRITTKSGFERRMEYRRKGAIEASRRRAIADGRADDGEGSDDSGFEGFE